MPHALIIDDQQNSAEEMANITAAEGFSVATAGSQRAARQHMALQSPDIVFLDPSLPDGNGQDLLDEIRAMPNTRVVLTGSCPSIHGVKQTLHADDADHVSKPINVKHLRGVLSQFKRPMPEVDTVRLQETLDRDGHFGSLWGRSEQMLRVHEQILRVAGTSVTVFVTGESGSGKEVVTRMVHDLSRRRSGPFLAVNCGAISPQLIESEMFGHEKGSFTGADKQHQGFFERASGGTLFLDEITEMPLNLQVKLLRVLETGTFSRVGSVQTQKTDVRIAAASNRDPLQAVADGHLREDLLYRLNVFPIHMPSLRERPQDIPLIANHFLDDIAQRESQTKHFSHAALSRLSMYHWPGNARELRNIVHRAYVMAGDNDTIVDPCLPNTSAAVSEHAGAPTITFEIGTPLAEIERVATLATLEHLGRHKERTAVILGVSLKTLYNRLKEYSTALPSLPAPTRRDGCSNANAFT